MRRSAFLLLFFLTACGLKEAPLSAEVAEMNGDQIAINAKTLPGLKVTAFNHEPGVKADDDGNARVLVPVDSLLPWAKDSRKISVEVLGRSGLSKYFQRIELELPMNIGQLKSLPSGSGAFVRLSGVPGDNGDPGVGLKGDFAAEGAVLTYRSDGALVVSLFGTPKAKFSVAGKEATLDASGKATLAFELDEMLAHWSIFALRGYTEKRPVELEAVLTPENGAPQKGVMRFEWSSSPMITLTKRFERARAGQALALRQDRSGERAVIYYLPSEWMRGRGTEHAMIADVEVVGVLESKDEHKLKDCDGYQFIDDKTNKPTSGLVHALPHVSLEYHVKAIDARTGAALGEKSFQDPSPVCPGYVRVGDGKVTSEPSDDDVLAWLDTLGDHPAMLADARVADSGSKKAPARANRKKRR